MSTPPGIKQLYKNIDWKNKDEKLAFYNKYFKESSMVKDHVKAEIESFKKDLLRFIAAPKKDNKKTTIEEVVAELGGAK